jgi:hypothetical protein
MTMTRAEHVAKAEELAAVAAVGLDRAASCERMAENMDAAAASPLLYSRRNHLEAAGKYAAVALVHAQLAAAVPS